MEYSKMTQEQRLAERIRLNREIDARIAAKPVEVKGRKKKASVATQPTNTGTRKEVSEETASFLIRKVEL